MLPIIFFNKNNHLKLLGLILKQLIVFKDKNILSLKKIFFDQDFVAVTHINTCDCSYNARFNSIFNSISLYNNFILAVDG